MTIALRAAGASTAAAAAVTAVNPVTPAGIQESDLCILTVQAKATAAGVAPTFTKPVGWTLIGPPTNNGTLVGGVDTGSNTVAQYYRVGATSSAAIGAIAQTGANSMSAVINVYSSTLGKGGWNLTSYTQGSDTTSGINGSLVGAAGLSITAGDWIVVSAGLSGDLGTITAQAFSAMSGATLGTIANRQNAAITTGNDSRMLVSDIPVTAGTSAAVPAFTYSNPSAGTSHARFLRIRENPTAGVVSDDFERADGALGNDWYVWNNALPSIVGGRMFRSDGGDYREVMNPGGGNLPADYTVTASIPGATVGVFLGLVGRCNDTGGVRAMTTGTSGDIEIGDAHGYGLNNVYVGSPTMPASWANTGIDHTMAMRMTGTRIELIIDGVVVVDTVCATNSTLVGSSYGVCGEGNSRYWNSVGTSTPTTVSTTRVATWNTSAVVFSGVRTNICTNPNFETDLFGWGYDTPAVISRDTVGPISGAASLKITGGSDAYFATPCVVGETFTMSFDYTCVGTLTAQPFANLQFGITINPARVYLPVTQSSPARFSITDVATTTENLYAAVDLTPCGTGAVVHIDNVLIEKLSVAGSYFDGSSVGAAWAGSANASVSTVPASLGRSTTWSVAAATATTPVSRTRSTTWNVLGLTKVSATRATTWGVASNTTTLWLDDFERADVATTVLVNNGWSNPVTTDGTMSIVSGDLVLAPGGGGYHAWVNPAGGALPADYTVTASIPGTTVDPALAGNSGLAGFFGLVGRWSGGNGVRVLCYSPSSVYVGGADAYNGAPNALLTLTNVPASWSNTAIDHTIALTMLGSACSLLFDGVVVGTFTSTINQALTGASVGICGEGNDRHWHSIGVSVLGGPDVTATRSTFWTTNSNTVGFTTTGSSFAPTVELVGGSTATVSWYVNGAFNTTGLSPTISFGSVGTRSVQLVVTGGTYSEIVMVNLGYNNADDTGRVAMGAAYNKTEQLVSAVGGISQLTGLVRFAAARVPLTSGLDFTGCSVLQFIECAYSTVPGVTLTGCTSLIRICLEQTSLTSPLDLNPVAGNLYDLRSAQQLAGTITFVPLTAPMANLYHFCVRDQLVINHPTATQLPVIEELWDWNTGQTGNLTVVSTGLDSLATQSNAWTGASITGGAGTYEVNFSGNALRRAAVDSILASCNSWGSSGGNVNVGGGTNSGPSAAGTASRDALIARGWSVTTNAQVTTTAVDVSRASTWSVGLASVTITRASIWATRSVVTDTQLTSWVTRRAAVNPRPTTWVTRAVVTDVQPTTWVVRSAAINSRLTTWAVRTPAVAVRSSTWDAQQTLTLIAAIRSSTWSLGQTLIPTSASRLTSWTVIGTISTVRVSSWVVGLSVASPRLTTWKALVAVAGSRGSSWVVAAPVSVSARSTIWVVRRAVTGSRLSTWVVNTPVTSSRISSWAVLQPLIDVQTTSWEVRAFLSAVRSSTWAVIDIQTVAASRAVVWSALSARSTIRLTTWQTRRVVIDAQSTIWTALAVAGTVRNTSWVVRAVVIDAQPTTWVVRTSVVTVRASIWDAQQTLNLIAANRSTSWLTGQTLIPASGQRATSWITRDAAVSARASSWTACVLAQSLRISSWASLAGRVVPRVSVWSTLDALGSVRTAFWVTRDGVAGSRVSTWAVIDKQPVSTVRVCSWSVLQSGAFSRQGVWDVSLVVIDTQPTSWVSRAGVVGSRIVFWTVGTPVAAARGSTWYVGQTIGLVAALRVSTWSVDQTLIPASGSRSTLWTTRAVVTGVRVGAWTACTPVQSTRGSSWSVLSGRVVSRSTSWVATRAVVISRASTWDTAASLTVSRASSWIAYWQVTLTRSSTWSLGQTLIPAGASRSTTWGLGQILIPTSSSRTTSWNTVVPVVAVRLVSWSTLARSVSVRASSWVVRDGVAAVHDSSWGVRTPVTSTRASSWSADQTIGLVTVSRLSTWSLGQILVPTSGSRSSSWVARAAQVAVRQTSWQSLVRLAVSRPSSWVARASVQVVRGSTWVVADGVAAVRSSTWSVGQTLALIGASRPSAWEVGQTLVAASTSITTSWSTRSAVPAACGTSWVARAGLFATRPTSWVARKSVALARVVTWDSRMEASVARASTWSVDKIAGVVSATRSTSWSVGQTLIPCSASVSTSWRTEDVVEILRVASWTAAAKVALASRLTSWWQMSAFVSTRQSSWLTCKSVSAGRSSSWAVLRQAASSRDALWLTFDGLVVPHSSSWTILTGVAASRASSWNLAQTVGLITSIRLTTWSLGQTLIPVAAARQSSWVSKAAVVATRPSLWSTASSLSRSISTAWAILVPSASSRQTNWRVQARVSGVRVATWADRTLVGAARLSRWEVIQQVGLVATFQATTWRVLQSLAPVMVSRSVVWSVTTSVAASRAASWPVLSSRLLIRISLWQVRAVAQVSRQSSWRVLTRLVVTTSAAWDTCGEREVARQSVWDVLGSLEVARTTRWELVSEFTYVPVEVPILVLHTPVSVAVLGLPSSMLILWQPVSALTYTIEESVVELRLPVSMCVLDLPDSILEMT